MAGVNTTSNIDQVFKPMLAEARRYMEHGVTMTGCVRTEKIPAGQGGDFRLPKWAQLADANDLSEGVDISQAEQLSTSLQTYTPTEVGNMVIFTDRVLKTVGSDLLARAGKLMGDSMARKIEKDGLTMLDGFSTALGSAGAALTWEHIGAAKTAIMGGGGGAAALVEPAPRDAPVFGVFHPHQTWILAKDFAPVGTYPLPVGLTAETIAKGQPPLSIAGVTIKEAGLLSIDTDNDSKGGVFSKEALILVMDEAPKNRTEESAISRGVRIVQTSWYVYGEYNDNWGREMLFDAIVPVS